MPAAAFGCRLCGAASIQTPMFRWPMTAGACAANLDLPTMTGCWSSVAAAWSKPGRLGSAQAIRPERGSLPGAATRALSGVGIDRAEGKPGGALISTGRVPSVKPYFAASDAGLNPMTLGAGSNVKLFEYLAARLPVISTAFGARGTELQPERDYIAFELGDLKDAIAKFVTRGNRGLLARVRGSCPDPAPPVHRHRRSGYRRDQVRSGLSIALVQDFRPRRTPCATPQHAVI